MSRGAGSWPRPTTRPKRLPRRFANTRRVPTITVVGSVRRGCETSGDLDIVAAGAPASLMEAFTTYRLVERVLARGETKASVLLWGGFQADLRLVPPASLGAALQYFTGSKAHNIALRDRALQRGMKLNEYGLYRLADDALVCGARRSEIYRALGLAPIPPELRENRGELDAAERGELPALDYAPRPPGRPPHALDGNRRPRRRRDDGGRPRAMQVWSTSPSRITASRWRWPAASTNGPRSSTQRASAIAQRAARRHHRACGHRMRHPT